MPHCTHRIEGLYGELLRCPNPPTHEVGVLLHNWGNRYTFEPVCSEHRSAAAALWAEHPHCIDYFVRPAHTPTH